MPAAMRFNAFPMFPLLLALAACAKTLPPAEDPDNPDNSDNSQAKKGDDTPAPAQQSALSAADPMVGVTVKDEAKASEVSCTGANIPDLAAALGQASCEVANAKPDEPTKDVKDQLEITVATDSPKVAPGTSSKVTVTYHNKGKAPLALDFTVDPEPRFDFQVFTLKGARVDKPAGAEPALPPDVQSAPAPDQGVARVTLAPNGTAKLVTSWNAVKFKWASKDRAKGATPGHGYPREPGAPLTKGKYVLRVVTPLVGVSEGSDHELSQPRTQVEVGNP